MSTGNATVLKVSDLTRTFGAVVAAQNINVEVAEEEVIGIIGANGAGKTTFVNMVTGWTKPSAGRIDFLGKSILGLPPRAIMRLGICRSFQVPQVFLSETVFDNLRMAYAVSEERGKSVLNYIDTPERNARVASQLERYSITQYGDQLASALPQGIRKLLDIAMATVSKPKILLLDEPTSGISVEEKFGLMDIIMGALKEDRTTVMFIEHDMDIIERYVARVIAFYQGEIICDAPTQETLANDKVREFVIGQQHHRDRESDDSGTEGNQPHA